jgi:hypothetical protein
MKTNLTNTERHIMGKIREYIKVMHNDLAEMETDEYRYRNLKAWLTTVKGFRRLEQNEKEEFLAYAVQRLIKAGLMEE